MRWGRVRLAAECLAFLVPVAFGSSTADAADWVALPKSEAKAVVRCLADHLLAGHAERHPDKGHPGVLAITSDLTEHPLSYSYPGGEPFELVGDLRQQKLGWHCKPRRADSIADVAGAPVATRGFWSGGPSPTVKIDCNIGPMYRRGAEVLAHYSCTPVEHSPPSDGNPSWCGKMLEPTGYTALFRKWGKGFMLVGDTETESADLPSRCLPEADPR